MWTLIAPRILSRYVALRREVPPRLFEKLAEIGWINARYPHEHPRPTAIVVREVESVGIGSHQDFARGVLDFDYKRLAVLVKSSQQLPVDLECWCAVRRSFLNAGQRKCKLTHRVESYRLAFAWTLLCSRFAQISSPDFARNGIRRQVPGT
jgi:hypothetical protein